MGYKNVCLGCKKAYNQGTDFNDIRKSKCPDCSVMMIQMNHRFRPPPKSDVKKWEVVKLLLANGFFYQKLNTSKYVSYPETMREAKEFIEVYKDYALEPEQIEKIMEDTL